MDWEVRTRPTIKACSSIPHAIPQLYGERGSYTLDYPSAAAPNLVKGGTLPCTTDHQEQIDFKKARIDDFDFHDLRHTFRLDWYRLGVRAVKGAEAPRV